MLMRLMLVMAFLVSAAGVAIAQDGEEPTPMKITPVEGARLKAIHDALPPDEQAQMRAHYEAMGVDLIAIFNEKTPGDAETARAKPILPMVQRKKFNRTPQAVLAARTKLGLEVTDHDLERAEDTVQELERLGLLDRQ